MLRHGAINSPPRAWPPQAIAPGEVPGAGGPAGEHRGKAGPGPRPTARPSPALPAPPGASWRPKFLGRGHGPGEPSPPGRRPGPGDWPGSVGEGRARALGPRPALPRHSPRPPGASWWPKFLRRGHGPGEPSPGKGPTKGPKGQQGHRMSKGQQGPKGKQDLEDYIERQAKKGGCICFEYAFLRGGQRGRKKPIYMRCKACNPPLPFQGQAFGFFHKFFQSLFDSFIFFLIVCHNSVCSANLSALSVLKNWLKLIIFVRRGRFKTLHHTPQSIVGKFYSQAFSQTPHLTTVWLGLCTKIGMFILHTPANPPAFCEDTTRSSPPQCKS